MWESEEQKERILSAVLNSLEIDLPRLWKMGIPEEDFVNLYSKVLTLFCVKLMVSQICCLMLENPANTKSKAIKKCIFLILGQLVKRYNQSFNLTNSIIHMLHNFEHLPPHLAELMESLVVESPQILPDVLRYEIATFPLFIPTL